MKIILANPRGFCAGVNMAIECVDQVLKHHGAPVYVYHEIVHNKHVVDDFVSRGVTFVNSIEEVPPGCTVVYSAHGVSPEIRRTSKDAGIGSGWIIGALFMLFWSIPLLLAFIIIGLSSWMPVWVASLIVLRSLSSHYPTTPNDPLLASPGAAEQPGGEGYQRGGRDPK